MSWSSCAQSIGTSVEGKGNVLVLIGPEGDYSEAELDVAADKGAIPVSLGEYTLRSEVAATVAITLIQNELGELDFHHEDSVL